MDFYCAVATAPLRAEPSHKAEMVSQLLFGEVVEMITEQNNWLKVKCCYDNYEAWIEKKSLIEIDKKNLVGFKKYFVAQQSTLVATNDSQKTSLLTGAEIFTNEKNEVLFNHQSFLFEGEKRLINFDKKNFNIEQLLNDTKQFLNTPYLWGGKSLFGIDCSGFVQTVFKINHVKLPRDAYQQAIFGESINLENITAGDLAFFENENKKITHVGILISNNQIIHCSIKVRIDKIDAQGIWNNDLQKYTHQLAIIKRII